LIQIVANPLAPKPGIDLAIVEQHAPADFARGQRVDWSRNQRPQVSFAHSNSGRLPFEAAPLRSGALGQGLFDDLVYGLDKLRWYGGGGRQG